MSEKYKKKIDTSPETVANFENRLQNISVDHEFSGQKGAVSEEFLKDTTNGGEKVTSTEEREVTNIDELSEHLSALDKRMRDTDISPKFNASGEYLPTSVLSKYFKDILFSHEYAPPTIFKVIQKHIAPVAERIQDLSREISKLEKANAKNGGAFAKILHSDIDDFDSKIESIRKKRENLTNSLVLLMKRVISEPAEFGLVKREMYNPKGAKMSVKDFQDRLDNRPYNELFTIDGMTLTIEDQKKMCARYLSAASSLQGHESKEARNILYKMCIAPILNRKYDFLYNDDYSQNEKDEAFEAIDTEMGEFLHGLENEKILLAYAKLIDEGELPDEVTFDDLPIDFPVLREREPDTLKREMRQIKDPEKRELYRLNHHRERVARMDP